MGIGDPLAPANSNAEVWSTGTEESSVITAARAIKLADGRNALLIDQVAGFEHPKRRHDLFSTSSGRVVALWSYAEPQGPYWSTVAVQPGAAGRGDDLTFFSAFSPDPAAPDQLSAQRLELAPDRSVLRASATSPVLSMLALGPYPSAAGARAAQDQNTDCLAAFWVLESNAVGLQKPAGFVLGAVSTRRDLAEQMLQQVSTCAPQTSVRAVESVVLSRGN
jgi:hypothetical protein